VKRVTQFLVLLALAAGLLVMTVGCVRERPSDRPPIHLNPDMDRQPKCKAQAPSPFFDDGAAMRLPVAGTVARGQLREEAAFYDGKTEDGAWLDSLPVLMSAQLLNRGRERYDIYCAPCHSRVGDGRGIMVTRGYVPPPTFHSDRIRDLPEGQLFDAISNGVRNMPSYRHQIVTEDRWAIVAYLRALQRSRNATIDDIPVELRETIK
jgi:mono/diheme cytochrome c family protein